MQLEPIVDDRGVLAGWMASGLEASQPRLERFDGSDLTTYKRWKRRAAVMLISLPSTHAANKLGLKPMEFVTGDAVAVEHLKVEDIAKTGGEQEIFRVLDERYMPLEKDDMSEALSEYILLRYPDSWWRIYEELLNQTGN